MTNKSIEELVEAIFRKSDEVVAIETHEDVEYLHKEHGAYDRVSLDERGNVKVVRVPEKYSVSNAVSEGSIDSRVVTAIDKKWKQSDVVKLLLQQHEKSVREEMLNKMREIAHTNSNAYKNTYRGEGNDFVLLFLEDYEKLVFSPTEKDTEE